MHYGIGVQWVVWQEEEQRGALGQLLFQEAGLGSWRLQPLQEGLAMFEHPAADGLGGEVPLQTRENLKENKDSTLCISVTFISTLWLTFVPGRS